MQDWWNNGVLKQELDKEYALEIDQLIKKNKNVVQKYKEDYGISYIGELTERFLDKKIEFTAKKLITLTITLAKSEIQEVDFQENQRITYIENVFEWISLNEVSLKEQLSLITSLIFLQECLNINFNKVDLFEINKRILLELKEEDKGDYWFEVILLFKGYLRLTTSVSSKEKIKSLIKNILNILDSEFSKLEFEKKVFIIKSLFQHIEGYGNNNVQTNNKSNILSTLELKVKDVKDNKEILTLFKTLKRISYKEIKDDEVEKLSIELSIPKFELLVIHLKFLKTPDVGVERVREMLYSLFLNLKELPEIAILNEFFYLSNKEKLKRNLNQHLLMMDSLSHNLLKYIFSGIFCDYRFLSFNSALKILKNDEKNNFLEDSQKLMLIKMLNTRSTYKKEDFDFYLDLKERYNLCLTDVENKIYIENMFKFNYFDIFDFDFIKENDYFKFSKKAIENKSNLVYSSNNIIESLYESFFPIEMREYDKNIKDIYSLRKSIDDIVSSEGNEIFRKIVMTLGLKDINIENMTDEDIKKYVIKKLFDSMIEFMSLKKVDEFIDQLFSLLQSDYRKYLEISEEEEKSIYKVYLDYSLVSEVRLNQIKELFLSEDEIKELKVEILKERIKKSSHLIDRWNCKGSLLKCVSEEVETFKISEEIREFFTNKLNSLINHSNNTEEWVNVSRFCFYILNLNIDKVFNDKILELTNTYFGSKVRHLMP